MAHGLRISRKRAPLHTFADQLFGFETDEE
jgi:hypothetical protein